MDPFALGGIVGAAFGAVAVGAGTLALRPARPAPPTEGKLTSGWRLQELAGPTIVARELPDIDLPAGATVYAAGLVAPGVLKRADVRSVAAVRAEFALDAGGRRAILPLSGFQAGALAIVTSDPDLVARLRQEADVLAAGATPYVERLPLAALAGRQGVTVETQGLVQAVIPYQGQFLLRLEDGDARMGVLVPKEPTELKDERVLVRGRLERDRGGYTLLIAEDVRRIR